MSNSCKARTVNVGRSLLHIWLVYIVTLYTYTFIETRCYWVATLACDATLWLASKNLLDDDRRLVQSFGLIVEMTMAEQQRYLRHDHDHDDSSSSNLTALNPGMPNGNPRSTVEGDMRKKRKKRKHSIKHWRHPKALWSSEQMHTKSSAVSQVQASINGWYVYKNTCRCLCTNMSAHVYINAAIDIFKPSCLLPAYWAEAVTPDSYLCRLFQHGSNLAELHCKQLFMPQQVRH